MKPTNSTTTKKTSREHVLPATTPHRCTPRSCHGPETRKGNTRPSHRRTNGPHGWSQNGWPSSRCDGWRTPHGRRHGWWASLLRGFSTCAFRKNWPNKQGLLSVENEKGARQNLRLKFREHQWWLLDMQGLPERTRSYLQKCAAFQGNCLKNGKHRKFMTSLDILNQMKLSMK